MSYSNCQFTWLKQRETLVSLAESLLRDSTYFDCQLYAEGHHFNVHRVILSCNSPVFSNILQEHNSDLPVITLEGVSSVELGALVEYMYTGFTRISPDCLRNFFQTAKSLQLAGLNHYDNAQIDKALKENGIHVINTDFQDNYEAYSQNILKYLDQSEASNESGTKELTTLNTNDESIFLDESSELTNVVSDGSVIYEKYHTALMKEEDDEDDDEDAGETLEAQFIENDELSQTCDAVDGSEVEEETDTSLMYNKFHSVFIRNENKAFNDNMTTVYSISKLDDLDTKEENEFVELQDEIKVTEEDENFVYVKLENNALDRLKETHTSRRKPNSSKSDVRFYTEKCLKMMNPVEKKFVIKRPRVQSLVAKDSKASADDKKIYICIKCGNKYSHKRTLLHHIHWICEQPPTYSCSLCPYRGKRKFQLKSHMKHVHLLKMN